MVPIPTKYHPNIAKYLNARVKTLWQAKGNTVSEKGDKALELFEAGCNCSQAVLAAFCEKYDLEPEAAMRMAAAFGGGMRRGEVCGAVTGALMVLGLRDGARKPEEQDRKKEANARTIAFMKAFEERYGSYLCRDLIKAAGKKVCDQVVPGAAELLVEQGY